MAWRSIGEFLRKRCNRRLLTLSLFCLQCLNCGLLIADPTESTRPNVVLIIADDQTYTDFGFMGNQRVQTPHLDRLAAMSARYPNGYVPSSVCRPSLVSILTGLYPHQHKIYFNHPPPGFSKLVKTPVIDKAKFDKYRQAAEVFVKNVPTLPRELAKFGYRSFQTGKFWEGHFGNAGFTDGMTVAEPSGGKNGDKMLANGELVAHGNGDHGLAIGRDTMQPIDDFIDHCGEQPFFVWYAPLLPHTPHDSPKKYFDLYAKPLEAGAISKHQVPYYAAISQFDDTVGHLVQSIEKRNLANSTMFVFVVDNGWEPDANRFVSRTNEWNHTKRSKRAPFDYGLRTPILIRWDGKTKAHDHPELVSSVDLMPTILSAAGIDENKFNLPGISLLPSAMQRPTASTDDPGEQTRLTSERAVFGGIYPGDASELNNPSADIAYRWVRHGDLKLIVPHSHNNKPPWNRYLTNPALFNVVDDPNESRNLIGDSKHSRDVDRLTRQLNDWWTPNSQH